MEAIVCPICEKFVTQGQAHQCQHDRDIITWSELKIMMKTVTALRKKDAHTHS